MPDNDKLESERNSDGIKVPEHSDVMFDFSKLVEGMTANAVYCIAPINDADGTRVGTNGVGKLLAVPIASDEVHMGKIAPKTSSISNSSEKLEKPSKKKGNNLSTHHYG